MIYWCARPQSLLPIARYVNTGSTMSLLSRVSGLFGDETDEPTEMGYECVVCGKQTELPEAACPNCGGQMEEL